jgi:hypothetical protein
MHGGWCVTGLDMLFEQIPAYLEFFGFPSETGAEHQDLTHAPADRMARRILREPTAHCDEQAQASPLRAFPGEGYGPVGVFPKDTKRERVGKDEAALQDLMRRPVPRRADRCYARLPVLHGKTIGARKGPVERI